MRYFRVVGFAIGLFASAAVAAQSADFIFVDAPNFSQEDVGRVFAQSSSHIFIIGSFTDLIGSIGLPVLVKSPDMKFDSELLNLDQTLLGVEGDGLLLPPDRLKEIEG